MERVLVIDDNPAIQKLVGVNLQARGYAVTAAATGEDALRLFAPSEYDLVLLDLIL
ncbi:MAG TPA: response regulator, partial [Anaerolineae bacterium]|nr:response regulator [Anaerolineae bacterium]